MTPVIVTMTSIIVRAMFSLTGVIARPFRVVACLSRAARISSGVGVVIRRLAVVTMPRRVVGTIVGGLSVAGSFIGILTIVVRMVAVFVGMLVLSRGRCHKK